MELLIVLSILLSLGLITVSTLFYFKIKLYKNVESSLKEQCEFLTNDLKQKHELLIKDLEQKRIDDLNEQEEELIETIDTLTDELEDLQDKNNSLVTIVDRIWNNAVAINNFYVKVLERGFLHDNYQVKQLSEQMINFIKDIEKIKSMNENLFEEKIEEEEE